MNKLTSLLIFLKDITDKYFVYVDMSTKYDEKSLIDNNIINEYHGEMEGIAQEISSLSNDDNNLELIANTKLLDAVSKIVEFFSSVSNDIILEKDDVNMLHIGETIDMAKRLPQN